MFKIHCILGGRLAISFGVSIGPQGILQFTPVRPRFEPAVWKWGGFNYMLYIAEYKAFSFRVDTNLRPPDIRSSQVFLNKVINRLSYLKSWLISL